MTRLKQIKESKELIFSAFMRLLENKTFDEITISEIAKEAGVVRMTVYRHFSEKEDIILFAFEQFQYLALDMINKMEHPSVMDLLIFRFKVIQESPYTKLLTKINKLDKLVQSIGIKYMQPFRYFFPELDNIYTQSFIRGGIDAMTERWIKEGMIESPNVMAEEVNKILKLFHETK